MNVYPKVSLFCPMMKKEITGQKCASCKHFGGVAKVGGYGAEPAMAISCLFEYAGYALEEAETKAEGM